MKHYDPSEKLKGLLDGLPHSPGVYLFKNEAKEIIYIGKAVNLRSRVRSYFHINAWHDRPKLAVMVPKIDGIETIVTNSEKEALLLEATLIKQNMPRYNVTLKDDRRYPWLAITYDVSFPRLVMVRDPHRYRKEHPQAKLFGPYVESGAMWQTVKVLRKVFPMRQRKTPLFKDRPCMNYHIGLCLGPCQNLVSEENYERMVFRVERFLAGRQQEVIAELKADMEEASQDLDFELAAKIRDRLFALETVVQKQYVLFQDQKISQDVLASAYNERMIAIAIIKVREGKLISSETITLNLHDRTSQKEAFESYVDQYYTDCSDINVPRDVLLEFDVEDMVALSQMLSSKCGHFVKISVPRKGQKLSLIEMAKKNAQVALEQETLMAFANREKIESLLSKLQQELEISQLPQRMECFDISNIQGSDNVASMVVFVDGRPHKADYRMFKIKSVEGSPNDFASMQEVVGRRYKRILSEGKPLPDLIVIDGGKGQLNAALEAFKQLGIEAEEINIVGLAKQQEEVYKPGRSRPLLLSRQSEALHLLQHIRDEAHRFALTYHRKLRAKRSIKSSMDDLPGVGKARRKLLLDYFQSFDKLKTASLDEIKEVKGISAKVAESIFLYLRSSN